jgi:hypothetical protein
MTPATSALLRLARARPVVVDILARDLDHEDAYRRDHATGAIERLSKGDPDLLPENLITRMRRSSYSHVSKVGEECFRRTHDKRKEPQHDYYLF